MWPTTSPPATRRVVVSDQPQEPCADAHDTSWDCWYGGGWQDWSGWEGAGWGKRSWDSWGTGGAGEYIDPEAWPPVRGNKNPTPSKDVPKVVAVAQEEWTVAVRMGSVQQVTDCIKKGLPCDVNLVFADSFEDFSLLKSAWSAFEVKGGMTVVAVGEARTKAEQLFHTRVRLTRNKRSPAVEPAGLLALSDGGPWVQGPKVISQTRISKVQRTTVRITVPSQYRQFFISDPDQDTVRDVLSDLVAAQSGVRSHLLTGGRWEWQNYKKDSLLVGFLRLPEASADALILTSGSADPAYLDS